MSKVTRILFTFAAIWALLAGLVIFFVPMGMSVSATHEGGVTAPTLVSFFDMAGWWGVWIPIAFAALYYGPLHFYRRGSRALAATFTVAAIILSVLAGFSIGSFYFPAALALLVGLVLLLFAPKK